MADGFTTRPELLGTHGMVATTHWSASAAGMAMLEAGGTAADAAVAAGFVLHVVEPHLNGLGGEAPILVQAPGDPLPDVICGQGPAPAAATPERLRSMGLDAVPGSGLVAACVPGAFDAWMTLLRDRGRLPLRAVLAPAIGYAENGHPLLPRVAAAVAAMADLFVTEWTDSAAVWLPSGRPPRAGERFRMPALASTYRRILEAAEAAGAEREVQIEAARDAFYRGFVAEALDAHCRQALLDGGGARRPGLLSADDLARYRTPVERPATVEHAGVLVCKPGPWSQGPVMLQQLTLLAAAGIDRLRPGTADWVHTVVECAKLAFADREAWYGDPDAGDVPLDALLDADYARRRAALLSGEASDGLRPGRPGDRDPVLPPEVRGTEPGGASAGDPTLGLGDLGARGDTCHVDAVDRDGLMVSATPSGAWLQSSPQVAGLGMCLGTRLQMTWLSPGLASTLRPGRRPRTTLSPTMVMRDGEPWIATGTPGGDQQDQWTLLVLLNHLHGGMSLQEAIDAPAFHTTHFPSSFAPRVASPREVVVESRFDAGVLDALRDRGHRLTVEGPWTLGRVSAVARDRDGVLRAAANPRGMQGYAVGR